MRPPEISPVEWHVGLDAGIPAEVAAAAERGLPIVAHVPRGAALDHWAAELLEECASVIRYCG